MKATGDRESFDSSITPTCFPATLWPSPRSAQDEWQAVSAESGGDSDMRRLLEMEWACRPVPAWARQVARQIGNLPPCGWCLLQAVEAICKNIGAGDGDAAHPHGCHRVGPHQTQLMSDYAVCLSGWLRGANPEMVAADTSEKSLGWRDWEQIAKRIGESLGEPTEAKVMLVRRLLAHISRPGLAASPAPAGNGAAHAGADEPPAEGRPAWRPGTPDKADPAQAELDARIRHDVPGAESWLSLINAAWPWRPARSTSWSGSSPPSARSAWEAPSTRTTRPAGSPASCLAAPTASIWIPAGTADCSTTPCGHSRTSWAPCPPPPGGAMRRTTRPGPTT